MAEVIRTDHERLRLRHTPHGRRQRTASIAILGRAGKFSQDYDALLERAGRRDVVD
jgi:hypothetical protein